MWVYHCVFICKGRLSSGHNSKSVHKFFATRLAAATRKCNA